jgi:hypothetical protein
VAGEKCFDAAVAIDSSGYLVRKEWFRLLKSLLRPGGRVFITHRTVHFWTTTQALIKAEAQEKKLRDTETLRYERSHRIHAMVRQGLNDGGLVYALMSFSKQPLRRRAAAMRSKWRAKTALTPPLR